MLSGKGRLTFHRHLFRYRTKRTTSAAHPTDFLLSLHTTKRRHWNKSFSCIVSDKRMQSAKQEAFLLLKHFNYHHVFYSCLLFRPYNRLIFVFFLLNKSACHSVCLCIFERVHVTENQRYTLLAEALENIH